MRNVGRNGSNWNPTKNYEQARKQIGLRSQKQFNEQRKRSS